MEREKRQLEEKEAEKYLFGGCVVVRGRQKYLILGCVMCGVGHI